MVLPSHVLDSGNERIAIGRDSRGCSRRACESGELLETFNATSHHVLSHVTLLLTLTSTPTKGANEVRRCCLRRPAPHAGDSVEHHVHSERLPVPSRIVTLQERQGLLRVPISFRPSSPRVSLTLHTPTPWITFFVHSNNAYDCG